MMDVVTMRFGKKYGPEYLRAWAAGVARSLTVPYRMTCFTDDAQVYDPAVHLVLTPDLGGWWNHLYAFSGWTANRQLLIDLDDVIVGSLDDLASYEGPHALNSDVYAPHRVDGGCQLIPAGVPTALYDDFLLHADEYRVKYHSDKCYYADRINDSPRIEQLYPGHWVSYKVNCQDGLPPNARIVGFHGLPKPADVHDAWVKEKWQ